MSTGDVPGASPANGDELRMGCWATHEDGSVIFVESTEGGRVVYSLFDTSFTPVQEYRDTMSTKGFEKAFTKAGWTWHDKQSMNWDLVIKAGAKDGHRFTSADDQLSEARRIARSRKLRREEFTAGKWSHMTAKVGRKGKVIVDKLQRAILELRT